MLIVSDYFRDIDVLERFRLIAEYKVGRVQAFAYTYEEIVRMVKKGNPLALSALIEGKPLFESERVKRLMKKAKQLYTKKGRTWRLKQDNNK